MPILETSNLTKIYPGNVTGVEGLSLSVEEGEIYGFLGSNGAGKTTTIRLLLNLLFPTSGSAEIFGHDIIEHHFDICREIGYIPSATRPNRHMTGAEFLEYMSRYSTARNPEKRKELLEIFELSERDLNRRIKDYSTGMSRKLAIIQAFEHNPRLIIMDEPTEGLDPVMQHNFYDLVLNYKNDGGTVFLSSHHLREVERVCDRAAIIRKGKLVSVEVVRDLMAGMSQRIGITFNKKISKTALKSPSLDIESFDGIALKGIIKGEINDVIRLISKHDVKDLTLPPRSLEDVFLDYYREEGE